MEIEVITNIVQTLGFPIALVIAMGIFIYKLWQQSVTREGKLYDELAACRAVNEKAISTIAHYADKLDTIQEDVKVIKEDIVLITDRIEH